jgi:hypothetical protein
LPTVNVLVIVVNITTLRTSWTKLFPQPTQTAAFRGSSHGKPIAKIVPLGDHDDKTAQAARAALLSRLNAQPVVDVGHWTREELYQD